MLVVALVLAALGLLAWVLFPRAEPEPVYQGKRLSEWLALYTPATNRYAYPPSQAADEAVRSIGTNGIPTLLRMLRVRDSALTLKLLALAEKQHFVKIHYVQAVDRNIQARWGFNVLGAEARDAVPALMKICQENRSPPSRWYSVDALGALGQDAKVALPLLVTLASDTNAPDPMTQNVRLHAIAALGHIHAEPQLVVPVLTKALSGQNRNVRLNAAFALGQFGPAAKPAVPALFKLLGDQDPMLRAMVADTIKKIDPETAALRKAELEDATAPKEQ